MSLCQYVNMSLCQYVRMQLFSLGIKMKVVKNLFTSQPSYQKKSCSECQKDFRKQYQKCQYVILSICQNATFHLRYHATFQLRYQNESCSECHQDVKRMSENSIRQSLCQYVSMSVCNISA